MVFAGARTSRIQSVTNLFHRRTGPAIAQTVEYRHRRGYGTSGVDPFLRRINIGRPDRRRQDSGKMPVSHRVGGRQTVGQVKKQRGIISEDHAAVARDLRGAPHKSREKIPTQPMAPTAASEIASHRRAEGRAASPIATPNGRTSQGLIINMRFVFPICRKVIAASSATKYSRKRRASGPPNERARAQAIANPATIPNAQNHGATDSLTKRQYKIVNTGRDDSRRKCRLRARVRLGEKSRQDRHTSQEEHPQSR